MADNADRQVSECIRRSRGDVLFLFTCHACVKLLFGGGGELCTCCVLCDSAKVLQSCNNRCVFVRARTAGHNNLGK